MKAHIVGGGFGGLAAAAYLIRNAEVPGQDIAIYETYAAETVMDTTATIIPPSSQPSIV